MIVSTMIYYNRIKKDESQGKKGHTKTMIHSETVCLSEYKVWGILVMSFIYRYQNLFLLCFFGSNKKNWLVIFLIF
jgi:hypothetical protein